MKGSTEFERVGHDATLLIGEMPGRVRPVLAVRRGVVVHTLASFGSDEQAREAIELIKLITRAEPEVAA